MGLAQCKRCHNGDEDNVENIKLGPFGIAQEGSVEELMQRLFELHDLNRNGTLEEHELVQLNKKIAVMHYGNEVDQEAVARRFQDLFRSAFDAQGKPVPYATFRRYQLEVLTALDKHKEAQVMILEQWIHEAKLGRFAMRMPSMQSISDSPFLGQLSFDEAPPQEAPQAVRCGSLPPTGAGGPVLLSKGPAHREAEAEAAWCRGPASSMISGGLAAEPARRAPRGAQMQWPACWMPTVCCLQDRSESMQSILSPQSRAPSSSFLLERGQSLQLGAPRRAPEPPPCPCACAATEPTKSRASSTAAGDDYASSFGSPQKLGSLDQGPETPASAVRYSQGYASGEEAELLGGVSEAGTPAGAGTRKGPL